MSQNLPSTTLSVQIIGTVAPWQSPEDLWSSSHIHLGQWSYFTRRHRMRMISLGFPLPSSNDPPVPSTGWSGCDSGESVDQEVRGLLRFLSPHEGPRHHRFNKSYYPPMNIQKARENHHLQWVNEQYSTINVPFAIIANCHKLPESKSTNENHPIVNHYQSLSSSLGGYESPWMDVTYAHHLVPEPGVFPGVPPDFARASFPGKKMPACRWKT